MQEISRQETVATRSTGNSATLDLLKTFQQQVDGLTQKAWAQYGSQMQCKKGCSGCCKGDFHISVIEVQLIRQRVKQLPPLIQAHIQENLTQKNGNTCPLLIDQQCSIYEDRPMLCRIFGFPVRIPASTTQPEHIATCELNFQEQQEQTVAAQCFDQETITNILTTLSRTHLVEQGVLSSSDSPQQELPVYRVSEAIADLFPTATEQV